MAYTREQRKVLSEITRQARRRYGKGGYSKPERRKIRSAFQTSATETHHRNLSYGDGTSVNWRQETSPYGSVAHRLKLKGSVRRYFNEADAAYHGQNPAALSQAVQRSAYPERYKTARGEAIKLTKKVVRGKAVAGGGRAARAATGPKITSTTKRIPGVDNSALRTAAKIDYLEHRDEPDAVLNLSRSLTDARDVPASSKTNWKVKPGKPGRPAGGGTVTHGPGGVPAGTKRLKGTANFEGHTVAAWIKPWLKYARKRGWKGTVNSGYRSFAEQTRIYNSGVRPAAVPGTSHHEGKNFPRGAIDVSDAATLSRILSKAGAPLKWAGSKDPVHFSHPYGGGY